MSKLLHTPHFTSIHRRTISAVTLFKSFPPIPLTPSSLSPPPCRFSLYNPHSLPNPHPHRNLSTRAFDSSYETKSDEVSEKKEKDPNWAESQAEFGKPEGDNGSVSGSSEEYPSGEFEFKEFGLWKNLVVKIRMLFAFPWERVRKGSVLTMKLRGQVRGCFIIFGVLN
ncbi:signal peptide peptidase [Actinidia rufa]|uniref:Signal peptide peptidase n=1 Tax=Actinidia rufa TaxID=165716 RepID=A0A7J0GMZ0_9ERIC|nr:signal peptide peptidase [Actinidia rufa]